MRNIHRQFPNKYIKIAMVIFTISALVALSVLPSFAYPSTTPDYSVGTNTYGQLSRNTCLQLFNAIAYQTEVIALGLNYKVPNVNGYYPAFVTGASENSTTTREVRVYFLHTVAISEPYMRITDIPEEIGEAGATLHINGAWNLYYAVYNFGTDDGSSISGYSNITYVGLYGEYTLSSDEQLICMFKGVANGINEFYNPQNGTDYSVSGGYWESAYNALMGQSIGDSESAYNEGYQDGYLDGEQIGYQQGAQDGYSAGYASGYDVGYRNGSLEIDIGGIISAVPEGAKSIINGALGFEVFGINVAGTLTALLVVAIVAYVVRKLMSR